VLLVLAVFDYGFQLWDYEKSIKMSKQEIKDEYKMMEGNPQIKSKIRDKQRQLAMRRMMSEVPSADVIITNPTHFAIAVKYDAKASEAPMVIAKGKDLIAQKIKETAKENKVPIVENKPLAQALYKSVEIGEKIPSELYKAVAEVLAFVYGLRGK
jgi:flagellar biosynthetic protein FlhB